MSEIAIRAGRLRGTAVAGAGSTERDHVYAYLGVPYATAARFAPPSTISPWTGTRDAVAFGPAAPQPAGSPIGGLVPGSFSGPTDEHTCLTVNVWTPSTEAGARRPVMVWFPGGAFTIGAASQPVYDGARLCAEQDVVVVTVNYRLGALGFLDARDAGGVANCGLRDAIAALEWVRDDIERFGGDPERVTAFGESAGGGIVLHACASPLARGLVHRAIVQSGATFNTLDAARAAIVRDALRDALGLDDAKLLLDVPVDAMLDAQLAAGAALLGSVGMMPFHPMVDDDVLPSAPVDALRAGACSGVPMMIGTTTDEMRLFLDLSAPPPPRDRLCARVARSLAVDPAHAETIVTTYERELGSTDANEVWAAIFSDVQMQKPAAAMREAHRDHGPTYSYLFGWPAAVANLGACHGIDIPFTFGNFVDGWAAFVGAGERDAPDENGGAHALSRALRNAWAAFARDGDPGWPQAPATMLLGREQALADDPLRARLGSLAE